IAAEKDRKQDKNNKVGSSNGTGIAPEEDRKKSKNSEVGCSSGTEITAEEDKKTYEQQGGFFPNDEPQVDFSSGSNTKVGSGKVRRQASPHHAHLSPVPPQTHPLASQGLPPESEERKGVQSKRNLHKSVRFQIDEQPEVLHPVVDDEEAVDSLSVLSPTVYRETVFIEKDEVATKEKCIPKRDENSYLRRLSEVEGWRKIDENKAHEKRVAGLIAAICQQRLHAVNNGESVSVLV
ncbi:hypothetical protein pdam_00024249, partial [Pocillopora damicornis]